MFQPHLLKNKLGQLLMRAGQRLLSSTIVASIEPVDAALADDESLPPAHWLTLVGQQAPQWLEESEHPQMVRYRLTQKKAKESKARPEAPQPIAKPQNSLAKKINANKSWAWFKTGPTLSEENVSQRSQRERSASMPSSEESQSKASAEQGVLGSNVDIVYYSDYPSATSCSADDNTSQNIFPSAEQASTFKDYLPPLEYANQTPLYSKHKPKLQSADKRSSVEYKIEHKKEYKKEYKKLLESKRRALVRVKPYEGSSVLAPEASPHLRPSRSSIVDSTVQWNQQKQSHPSFAASESSEYADELRSLTANPIVLPEVESTKLPAWSRQFTAAIKSAMARLQNEKQSKNEPVIHSSGVHSPLAHSLLAQNQNDSRNSLKKVALENPTSTIFQKQSQNKQAEFTMPIQKTTQKPETHSLHQACVQPLLKWERIKQTVDAALWPELHRDEHNTSEAWPKLPSECKNTKVSDGRLMNLSEAVMGQDNNRFEQRQALEQRGRLWSE